MKNKPQRMCAVCRQHKDFCQMIRVVKTNDGSFYVDAAHKLEGRGAYVCLDDKCIQTFSKTKCLNKAFRCEVPSQIYDRLKEELEIANSANKQN